MNTFDHAKFSERAFDVRNGYLMTLLDIAKDCGCVSAHQCIAAVSLYTNLPYDIVDMAADTNFDLPASAE